MQSTNTNLTLRIDMQDTPKEAATGDKAARDLMLSELLQVCTPAPWFTKREGFSTVYIEASIGGGWRQEVAACGPNANGFNEQEANAKLIALAPTIAAELIKERAVNAKLLKALKSCALVCAGETSNKRGLVEALESARDAIKQAEEL
jgi:hypothetical protein